MSAGAVVAAAAATVAGIADALAAAYGIVVNELSGKARQKLNDIARQIQSRMANKQLRLDQLDRVLSARDAELLSDLSRHTDSASKQAIHEDRSKLYSSSGRDDLARSINNDAKALSTVQGTNPTGIIDSSHVLADDYTHYLNDQNTKGGLH